MQLALDIGNSTVQAGVYRPGETQAEGRFYVPVPEGSRPDQIAIDINVQLDDYTIEETTITSVRLGKDNGLAETLAERLPGSLQLDYQALDGIISYNYPAPETVGMDRWMNSLAARSLYQGSTAVIDLGSATTTTLIDGEGRFTGGFIAPGREAMLLGLTDKAPHLPKPILYGNPADYPAGLAAQTSADAVALGVSLGYEVMVAGLMSRLAGQGLKNLIATGGGAATIQPSPGWTVDLDLTLTGIILAGRRLREQ